LAPRRSSSTNCLWSRQRPVFVGVPPARSPVSTRGRRAPRCCVSLAASPRSRTRTQLGSSFLAVRQSKCFLPRPVKAQRWLPRAPLRCASRPARQEPARLVARTAAGASASRRRKVQTRRQNNKRSSLLQKLHLLSQPPPRRLRGPASSASPACSERCCRAMGGPRECHAPRTL